MVDFNKYLNKPLPDSLNEHESESLTPSNPTLETGVPVVESQALEASSASDSGAQTAQGSERKGAWILTYLGVEFYPFDPRVEDIQIEDIAHALSMQCR